ncbi:phosphoenolpyruvate--protein phosphotransferase [Roseateles oligotrophus]|uniref:phosphoenolpyruvate--protein phosphotransferase n=1 Tax=Roseateles oligotrophus TaxID=1769250 RepID=A0ABT2YMJ8_9BURK|nr:phosphoenolpyruvate--protein phosphotransferase [Roseateles oligotrophus]MCV2371146.1 phosphoenolpyruvate--protein phosphotransferase [Roseateles oligotrophus]
MHRPEPKQLRLLAPLSGVLLPLEQVPDLVFAQKMVGDGISLDPTSEELLAPVAGKITQLHDAHHALTILTDAGPEILLHIGVDTVLLKGAGFMPLVKLGDHVLAGQALIRFDADAVALSARSLLTQIVVANGESVSRLTVARGRVVAGRDTLMVLDLAAAARPQVEASLGSSVRSDMVLLPNPAGLHARPAAVLAAAAKKFVADTRLVRGAEAANAKSLVAIMALSTQAGDAVHIQASGPDAAEAAKALAQLLAQGCGEAVGDAPAAAAPVPAPSAARASPASLHELLGVSASPGLAVGHIVQYRVAAIAVAQTGGSPQHERARLEAALHEAGQQLETLKLALADPAKGEILAAHQELLEDPDLFDAAIVGISAGHSAGYAWRDAFGRSAGQLEALNNALLRERANDIRDVGRRVLALLAGVAQAAIVVPENSILIAEELSPSDTASLDRSKVLGFCTTTGGATSHVAILARSLGIPAICGIAANALLLAEGSQVLLDGSKGILHSAPSADEVAGARKRMAQQAERRAEELAQAASPAITLDGHRIEVVANVRNAADTREGVANGAEGVGLLRSEFLFDERETAPSEDEQAQEYCAVAEALGPKRVLVIRTLDVGGDKPLSYLPLPKEDNPFLGLRGVRVSLAQPAMFRTQLRAILRAAGLTQLHIMFPMIATLEELREAKAILAEEQATLGVAEVKVGLMIEVPSAALLAEQFAREADFFSIGSNDLTQYTLAMDRGHPQLAKKADGLHPAVLKMIALSCEGARKQGKWVGVCGGLASDAMAVPVLIGLGVTELSASVPAIPAIKAQVKRLSLAACQALAQEVLLLATASEVRARLAAFAE